MERTRFCPHCRSPLLMYKDEYRCLVCRERFKKDEMDRLPRKAMELRGRIKDAEKNYWQGVEILSHLDKSYNRRLVADIINRAGYGYDVKPEDFEGARLDTSYLGEHLRQRYGLRAYPLVIIIAPGKAREVEKKFRDDPNVAMGGIMIHVKDPPFDKLGGIRLSFSDKVTSSEHEDIHGTSRIYRGLDSGHDTQESYILSEINSFRSDIQHADYFLTAGNREGLERLWNGVKKTLIEQYVPTIVRKGKSEKEQRDFLVKGIEELIPIVVELQMRYDESVLSRIIMKSYNFEQFKTFAKRDKTLGEWHERAIRARENQAIRETAEKLEYQTPLHEVECWLYDRVEEYWRFRGRYDDKDARWKYVRWLIKRALMLVDRELADWYRREGEDYVKKLDFIAEKEFGIRRKVTEDEKRVIEKLKEGLEKKDVGGTKKEKMIVLKIRERLKEKGEDEAEREKKIVLKIKKRMKDRG